MKIGLTPQQLATVKRQRRLGAALKIMLFVAETKTKGATCDECVVALEVPHQTASARFHELVQAGCLVSTRRKRPTTSGGRAVVYIVPKEATFLAYLSLVRLPKASAKSTLTATERVVLTSGMRFLKRWGLSRTPKQRQTAIVSLVDELRRVLTFEKHVRRCH